MASTPASISESVVAFLASNKRIQGIDFAQSPGVALEDLEKWDKQEGYTLPAGKYACKGSHNTATGPAPMLEYSSH